MDENDKYSARRASTPALEDFVSAKTFVARQITNPKGAKMQDNYTFYLLSQLFAPEVKALCPLTDCCKSTIAQK